MSRRLLLAILSGIALAMPNVQAQSPFGQTMASISVTTIGTPTTVVVTSHITATNVLPSTIQLQRLNANGTVTTIGTLRDDGLNGDAVMGDRIFSLRFTINQSTPAILTFRVSAGLVGVIRRVTSDRFDIVVRGNQTPEEMVSQLAAQLRQGDMARTLSHFSPSSANQRVLNALDPVAREGLADAFARLRLTHSEGTTRFYDMPWPIADGSPETTRVIIKQGGLGEWLVVSW
jgi:hypothetical protein